MRKLFTVLAALMLSIVVYAQSGSASLPVIADPVDGSTLEVLESVKLKPASADYTYVNPKEASLITVTKDGADFCGVTLLDVGDLKVTLKTPANQPGTYVINFPVGSIDFYDNFWDTHDLTEPFSLTYTVTGDGGAPIVPEGPVKATPANNSTVESLSTITINSINGESVLGYMNGTVTKDGADFCVAKVADYSNVVTLATTATEPGVYVVSFGYGAFYGEDSYEDCDAFSLTYTIAGGQGEEPTAAPFPITPAPGSTVETLTSINIQPNDLNTNWLDIGTVSEITVTKNGADFCGVRAEEDNMGYNLILTTPATEAGLYVIHFTADNISEGATLYPAFDVAYEVTGGQSQQPGGDLGDLPVAVDPANGSTVGQLESFQVDPAEGSGAEFLLINDKSVIKVKKDGADFCDVNTIEGMMGYEIVLVTPATEAGTYTIEFPEGAVISSSWEGGETPLPAFTVTYIVTGEEQEKPTMTFNPADGSTVEELSKIYVEFPGMAEFGPSFMTANPSVKKDGENFTTISFKSEGAGYNMNLAKAATEPGVYTVTIPAECLYWRTSGNADSQFNEEMTLTYTIEAPAVEFKLISNPADGATVTEAVSEILIASQTEGYPGFEIVAKDGVNLYKDGELWSTTTNVAGAQGVTVKFANPANEKGTYELRLDADSYVVSKTTDESYEEIQGALYKITFTVDIPGALYNIEIPYSKLTPNSEDGPIDIEGFAGAASEQKSFNFQLDGELYANPGATVNFYSKKSGYNVEATVRADAPKENSWSKKMQTRFYLDLDPAITVNGTYTITIPRGILGDADYVADNMTGNANKAAVFEIQIIGGEPEPETHATYDLDIIKTKPAAGQVDLAEYTWTTTNVIFDIAYDVPEEGKKELTLESADGSYKATGVLKFPMRNTAGGTTQYSFNANEVTKNGLYTLTIPEGTFGDAEWLADPETGHANKEIKVVFLAVNGSGDAATCDLTVTTTPEQDGTVTIENAPLAVTLSAAGDLDYVPGMTATLTSEVNNYSGTVKITGKSVEGGNTVFTTEATPALVKNGKYTLTIPEGMFGDADFISKGNAGHANAGRTVTFNVTGGEAEQQPTVYDLQPISVMPAADTVVSATDLERIVVVWPEGTVIAGDNARGTLDGEGDINVYDTAFFIPEEEANTWYINFQPLKKDGQYTFIIKEGQFSDMDNAHANPEIRITYNYTVSGIDGIDADEQLVPGGVYNLQGVYMGESLKGLAPGIYIVKGSKVLIEK